MIKTIRQAHHWAFSFLRQNSDLPPDDARFAAELLLRHLLAWDRTRFFAYQDDPLPPELWPELERLIERRSLGVPIQYLIGSQEFYGRVFHVSPHVLIPRPETEGLVETVLKRAATIWGEQACSVVDVGTGSGAIAVTLAAERPKWQVTAIDLSPHALQTARNNAARHGVEQRIHFRQGDLVAPLTEQGKRVDMIVSNPPYIPTEELKTLAVEVREHEPVLALDGGEDGLEVYRKLATAIPHVINEQKGLIALEVGIGQSDRVAELLQYYLPRGEIEVATDLAGIERIVCLHWS